MKRPWMVPPFGGPEAARLRGMTSKSNGNGNGNGKIKVDSSFRWNDGEVGRRKERSDAAGLGPGFCRDDGYRPRR
ncbi:hypothetical protein L3D22_08865 [Lysobacter soli]|uniref:hypothetical protein n=1 Tax=Lysobacter soli TaxID=453783 RepID=UPI00209C71C0|nr:hypothetical protein [Lysobacter soli]UTA55888.1 hypothetical protein L3D22_08865 [Lysobacter soli]